MIKYQSGGKMARININNIENVEGKYHLMFHDGKIRVENAKNDLRYAFFSLLFFACLVLLFIVISGFNLYYVGFAVVFLILFFVTFVYLKREKKKGIKDCVYAVQNSKTTDIVAKQVDNRKAGRVIVNSMSSTLDKYDEKEKFPGIIKKYKRKIKHDHIVGIINQFEEESKKKGK